MEKAVIGSVSCHIVAGLALGIIGWHMSQVALEEAYEIDLSIPVQEEQALAKQVEFPKPLAAEEVVNRVAAVTQNPNPNAGGGGGGTPSATPTPIAPASVVAPGEGTMPIPGAREGNQTSFNGLGEGYNTEGGPVGEGVGSGSGAGIIILVVLAAVLAASSVSVAGLLGFVGLIVPHLMRLVVGSDFEYLLPASAVFGAALLVGADTFARTIFSPNEIPVGIFLSFLGAPFFLYLLKRRSRG